MQQQITCISPLETVKSKIRSAAYIRVSSNSDDQLNSFEAQHTHYKKMLESNPNEEFVDIYADEGITGTSTKKRDDFNRMIADSENGKIDRIYCKSVSRFARNTAECLNATRRLKSLGVTVYFEKENLDTASEEDEFRLTLLEYQAQEESISISKNLRIGIKYRMEKGDFLASTAPYGYRFSGRILVICEEEAKIVRRIFNEYANGKGIKKITDDLNEEKIPCTDKKSCWNRSYIKYILSNEKYTGAQLYCKTYSTDKFPFKRVYNHGEHEMYYIEESHEAIISHELFDKVQKIKETNLPPCVANNYDRQILSGKIHCSKCGKVMRTKKRNTGRVWICRKHDENADSCDTPPVPDSEVIRAFIRMYNKLKANDNVIIQPIISQLVLLKNSIASNNAEYASINKKSMLIKDQIVILEQLKKDNLIDRETFIRKKNELNSSLNSLRSQRRLFFNNSDADRAIVQIKKLSAIISNGPSKLTEFDKDIFDQLIEDITADSSSNIKFKLIGGLVLKEEIERITR